MILAAPRHVALIAFPEQLKERDFASRSAFPQAPVQELLYSVLEHDVDFVSLFPDGPEAKDPAGIGQFIESVGESVNDPRWRNTVALEFRGEPGELAPENLSMIRRYSDSAGGARITMRCHIGYSGRGEIVSVAKEIADELAGGKLTAADVDPSLVSDRISQGMTDPDLLICTGGGRRISDSMIWQMAYAEIHLVDKPWQEFTRADFSLAIQDYARRERRFGKLKSR